MSSQAQIEANRKNAKKSTGPKTPEGKAAAAQNALKHGLSATRDVVITEEQTDFDSHRNALIQDLNPQTPTESILAARIISLSWRLRRAINIQDQAIDAIDDNIKNGESPWRRREEKNLDPDLTLGRIVYHDFVNYRAFERLLMYEKRIENSLYKTMQQLKTLQDARKTNEIDPYGRPHVVAPTSLAPNPVQGETANPHKSAIPKTTHENTLTNRTTPVPPKYHPPQHLAPGFTGGSPCPQGHIPNSKSTAPSAPSPLGAEKKIPQNKPNQPNTHTHLKPLKKRTYNRKTSNNRPRKQTQSNPNNPHTVNSQPSCIEQPTRPRTITRRY